ncbi:MAG: AbrB/MazE/SpoVT family DNA-binding domain-containing protein [Candidatus Omnitrophica bacterium]|nr:AbrB/MazE/SpoVT family DNA-binding domain-containing protein [Candidatus Omnitrophota bacterium]
MSEVLVSTKYQVVIPKAIRTDLHIKAGQRMVCIVKDGVMRLIPVKPMSEMRGFIKKPMSLHDLREKKDRIL